MQTYNWVIVEINHQDQTYYKLLCQIDIGMYGWRINSGITRVETNEDHYVICGASGSVYICGKQDQKVSRTTSPILDKLLAVGAKVIDISEIKEEFLLKAS